LTEESQRTVHLKYKARQLKFVEAILRHRVFNETLRLYFKRSEMPSRDEIVEIMTKSNLYQVGAESTFQRRASTVASWINWVLDLQR
jgi:hypothetical protein